MPTDLTLPGSIPGLVQDNSRCMLGRDPCVAMAKAYFDGWWVSPVVPWDGEVGPESLSMRRVLKSELRVSLRSRTSRVHAAWWLDDKDAGSTVMRPGWRAAYLAAKNGEPMTDEQIRHLRDLVLAVHGGER